MKKIVIFIGALLIGVAAVTWLIGAKGPRHDPDPDPDGNWLRVMSVDVTKRDRDFKADLGNGQIAIAKYVYPVGWDVAVYAYPLTPESRNLLEDDENWMGPQPWQSFAMTRRNKIYPDTRVIPYGAYEQAIKIVLRDCETEQIEGMARFTQGKIDIYYRPPKGK